jgi:sugar lactone lactonase YvrE
MDARPPSAGPAGHGRDRGPAGDGRRDRVPRDHPPARRFQPEGIAAAKGGRVLVVVQSNTGRLFKVNPSTGVTRQIDLGGALLTNGDGLLLRGRTLFVVRNRLNLIAVVRLTRSQGSGRVVAELTDPDLDVPTTVTFTAGRLYAVNARFGTAPDPATARYDVVRVG